MVKNQEQNNKKSVTMKIIRLNMTKFLFIFREQRYVYVLCTDRYIYKYNIDDYMHQKATLAAICTSQNSKNVCSSMFLFRLKSLSCSKMRSLVMDVVDRIHGHYIIAAKSS
jgi:hypothetical protein